MFIEDRQNRGAGLAQNSSELRQAPAPPKVVKLLDNVRTGVRWRNLQKAEGDSAWAQPQKDFQDLVWSIREVVKPFDNSRSGPSPRGSANCLEPIASDHHTQGSRRSALPARCPSLARMNWIILALSSCLTSQSLVVEPDKYGRVDLSPSWLLF